MSSYRGRPDLRSLSLPKKDKTKKSFTTVKEGTDLNFRSSLPRMFFMQYWRAKNNFTKLTTTTGNVAFVLEDALCLKLVRA